MVWSCIQMKSAELEKIQTNTNTISVLFPSIFTNLGVFSREQ